MVSRNPDRPLHHARLKEVLHYNPDTGVFTRLDRFATGRQAGNTTFRSGSGKIVYRIIGLDGSQYFAHRLVWFYVHGVWPKNQIDHINGDGLDNRLCNLREATIHQNLANVGASKNSKTGLRGVFRHANGKYRAQITKSGKVKSLGYFDDPQAAHSAYLEAAKRAHGEFARVTPAASARAAGP